MITAILLAAGFSRRMTADKLLLDFHGQPVIDCVMKAITSCPFHEKLLIQREEHYTAIASKYGFQSLKNIHASDGQSTSVQIGVRNSHPQSAFMFFVGDQPCLTVNIINQLLDTHREHPEAIIVPAIDGQFKNPVIFPAKYRTELLAIDGDKGGRTVIKKHPEHVRTVDFQNASAFLDIDTTEDYQFLLEYR